jgi:hypothetical protein
MRGQTTWIKEPGKAEARLRDREKNSKENNATQNENVRSDFLIFR